MADNRFLQEEKDGMRDNQVVSRKLPTVYSTEQFARLDGLCNAMTWYEEKTPAEILEIAQQFADFIAGAPNSPEGL